MKRSSKELKRISRDLLNDRYGVPMGAFVLANVIVVAVGIPFSMSMGETPTPLQLVIALLAQYLITLISFVLNAGVIRVHLNMTRAREFKITQIFAPFKEQAERFFGAAFLISLLSIACCLPCIAGGIFFYLSDMSLISTIVFIITALVSFAIGLYICITYNFVSFFLLDCSQMRVIAAFKESRHLMHGNRWRFFYILLSFIGWELLIACSLGIASLWVNPYMNQTYVCFYLDCTGELDQIPVRSYSSEPNQFHNSIF